jgi:hypothetical protein
MMEISDIIIAKPSAADPAQPRSSLRQGLHVQSKLSCLFSSGSLWASFPKLYQGK